MNFNHSYFKENFYSTFYLFLSFTYDAVSEQKLKGNLRYRLKTYPCKYIFSNTVFLPLPLNYNIFIFGNPEFGEPEFGGHLIQCK